MIRINFNDISEAQLRKLQKGLPVQLSFSQLKDQKINDRGHIKVHPDVAKRVSKAHVKSKGSRVVLSEPELIESGEGFRDAWNWIKNKAAPAVINAAKWAKKNVINSPFYQETVRPELHKLVGNLESALPDNAITRVATKGVDALGEFSGGYGLNNGTIVVKVVPKKAVPKKAVPKKAAPKKAAPKKAAKPKAPKGKNANVPIGGSFLPL